MKFCKTLEKNHNCRSSVLTIPSIESYSSMAFVNLRVFKTLVNKKKIKAPINKML